MSDRCSLGYLFICLSTGKLYYTEPQCEVFIGSLTRQLCQLHNVVSRIDINGFVLTQTKIAAFKIQEAILEHNF